MHTATGRYAPVLSSRYDLLIFLSNVITNSFGQGLTAAEITSNHIYNRDLGNLAAMAKNRCSGKSTGDDKQLVCQKRDHIRGQAARWEGEQKYYRNITAVGKYWFGTMIFQSCSGIEYPRERAYFY